MKLRDAIASLDKSKYNKGTPDIASFIVALQLNGCWLNWHDDFDKRVTMYFIQSWICTDTRVGTAVYFLDDEVVAFSVQSARKNDIEISFLSKEAAEKVRQFILSLVPELAEPHLIDLDAEIPEFEDVDF